MSTGADPNNTRGDIKGQIADEIDQKENLPGSIGMQIADINFDIIFVIIRDVK